VDKAVEYALALISGWTDKKRAPFEEALEDLRAAAAHNQDIYKQAAEALKELSTQDRDLRDLAARAHRADLAAKLLKQKAEEEAAEMRAKLEAAQRDHENMTRDWDQAALAREKNISARETAVAAREHQAEIAEAAAAQRESEAEKLTKQAAAVRDRYMADRAEIATIIRRTAP
jgi:chromosome segregation ATPase